MPHLPGELCSLIIANLQPDIDSESLKCAALSFRQLTFPSHRQLFSHIIIRSPERCCSRFHPFGGSSASFRTLLDNSPHIANMVRCLEIFDTTKWYTYRSCTLHRDFKIKKSWLQDDRDLHICLPRLKKLEALTSTFFSPGQDSHVIPADLVDSLQKTIRLPSLIHLDMEGGLFSVLRNSGPQLKHLVLRNDEFDDQSFQISSFKTDTPILLESLLIEERSSLSNLNTMFLGTGSDWSGVSLHRLKKLYVYLDEDFDHSLPPLLKILHEARDSIEDLVLSPYIDASSFSGQRKYQNFDQPLNLSSLKCLKRFHVQLEFNDDGVGELNSNIPWFINILSSSKSDNLKLEEIIISFVLDFDEGTDDIIEPLCDVAAVLLGGRFPRLHSMRIFIDKCGSTRDDIIEHLGSSPFAQRMRSRDGFVLSLELGAPDRDEDFICKPWWLRVVSRDKYFL